ncbi:hypothetical protein [Aestuariivivens sediminis]|uniref:hypothetical protein n=1 Tax=Aestuariivivens sediminis TaxID=2913557 RepID=UPI001F56BF3E|nr:hypothetical protein [Aestuariivivens sediminis]
MSLLCSSIWALYRRAKPEYYSTCLVEVGNLFAEVRVNIESATPNTLLLLETSGTGYNVNSLMGKERPDLKQHSIEIHAMDHAMNRYTKAMMNRFNEDRPLINYKKKITRKIP